MKPEIVLHRISWLAIPCLLPFAPACVSSSTDAQNDTNKDAGLEPPAIVVDTAALRSTVGPYAFGMHTSVYDNALHSPSLPERIAQAGIKLFRYPGGGYSDNYHWSVHKLTPWANGNPGYLAGKSDFGSYVTVLESTGTAAMITVNYGSNLQGTGPGEPNEAAAWVAYANGAPDNETVIGVDSTGIDWKTVGYWASLRASAPLAVDDGYNFLRIAHSVPLGITYWEIGNEVFGNGYYAADDGYEFDLHLAYDIKPRNNNPALAPAVYGRGVVAYAVAMRNVDPTIRVGAVLVTPPKDYSWGPNWNTDVLAQCGTIIDFVIVHYYPAGSASSLPDAPRTDVPQIFSELKKSIAASAGANAANIEVTVTETGPTFSGVEDPFARGLFAVEDYVTFLEYGAVNVDWLELHAGGFLNERNDNIGPAFQGIQLAHSFVQPGDSLVKAKATMLGVIAHAALRADQTVALMVANLGTVARTGVPVTISGPPLASDGTRIDYQRLGTSTTVDGTISEPTPLSDIGNEFSIDLPPKTVTLITIPLATP